MEQRGTHPWQNDSALDWLDEFAAASQLMPLIESGLNLPLEQIDRIRAAAHLLLQLTSSEVSVFPETTRLLALARQRLNDALESGQVTPRQLRLQVLSELDALSNTTSKQSIGGRNDESVADHIAHLAARDFGLMQYDVVDVDGDLPETRPCDVVGTGFLDPNGVLHLQLEDSRPNGFLLKCRCVPEDVGEVE